MKYVAASLGILLFVSCSDDSRPQRPIFNNTLIDMTTQTDTGTDTGGTDSGEDAGADASSDAADMGDGVDLGMDAPDMESDAASCPDVPCDTGEMCVQGVCVAQNACASVTDLGTLTDGGMLSAQGNLATATDVQTANCNTAGREQIFKFTLTEQLEVTYAANWVGQFDGLIDIRTTCDDASSSLLCEDSENSSKVLDAGEYFLYAEARFGNPGEFTVQLTGEAASCTPGVRTCNGDNLELCPAANTIQTIECGETCVGGECNGKTCAAPISVTAPGGLFNGDSGGYQAALDFAGNADCGNVSTPGYEVVFYLPGITMGDIVQIGTVGESAADPDININAIFIMESMCGDSQVCVEHYTGYESAQSFGDTVDWVAPSDGDFYIVIDNLLSGNSPFRYKVQIIDM